jgi:hypothetical protein
LLPDRLIALGHVLMAAVENREWSRVRALLAERERLIKLAAKLGCEVSDSQLVEIDELRLRTIQRIEENRAIVLAAIVNRRKAKTAARKYRMA